LTRYLVKANGGAAGIGGQPLKAFAGNVANKLYQPWNRLASGSCMPPAVRRVDIPKIAMLVPER